MATRPILCIDDEPSNLALVKQSLMDHYRLVFARNGHEGLEAVKKHNPALILLDVEMPGVNGFDVIRQLKSDPLYRSTPVIFVTSLNQEFDEQKGFDAGAVDYITKPISPAILRARVRTHLSLVQAEALETSQRAAIYMLADAGHYNDEDTGLHIWRMAAYSKELALHIGWAFDAAEALELAAPMHDTGKIGIPDAILKKPGKLTQDEWGVMKTHSQIGYDILSRSKDPVFQLAAEIALHHHEKCDGSGYPAGLHRHQIPESARIVAVADVFDALTVKRPYKDAWPIDRACDTLVEMSENHLDKELVTEFINIMPKIIKTKHTWDERERNRVWYGDIS